jgi:hypothetical protein
MALKIKHGANAFDLRLEANEPRSSERGDTLSVIGTV